MKTLPTLLVIGLLAMLPLDLTGADRNVDLAIQQSDEGVLVAMDYGGRNLTLNSADCGQRVVFFWNDSTRFVRGGQKVLAESFEPGMEVRMLYRLEAGRNLLREVSWHKDPMIAAPQP